MKAFDFKILLYCANLRHNFLIYTFYIKKINYISIKQVQFTIKQQITRIKYKFKYVKFY